MDGRDLGSLLVFSLTLALASGPRTARAAASDAQAELDALVTTFSARTGARLVFESAGLPDSKWFDIMVEMPQARRIEATRLAIVEAYKYPEGYLGAIGLHAVGVFAGLASRTSDGFRPWSQRLGGYRYFGKWNGDDAIVAAYYDDGQLPLTFHHEVFHRVDATGDGSATDDRFARAITGETPYTTTAMAKNDLAALERYAAGAVLADTVSAYATKSAGEDQAETARYLLSHLPDALVQIARKPELAGSQRLLHVMDQYAGSIRGGPDLNWWIAAAQAGDPRQSADQRALTIVADALDASLRARVGPRADDGTFIVWGQEGADGVNRTLRDDIARFATVARALNHAAEGVPDSASILAAGLQRELDLLTRYHDYIASRWTITAGTEQSFARAREALGDAVEVTVAIPDNPYLGKLDVAIDDLTTRAAIRRVQPATVRLGGGSGVNLDRHGVILTAAHVVDAIGTRLTVRFPDGTEVEAQTTALDDALDLAVLTVEGRADLPSAPIAAAAPAAGTAVVIIGQPGKRTPSGAATGYQPWHVSLGQIRGFRGAPLADQSLGGTKHDAWTYWGHSGSPLFDAAGRIVGLHNSWDAKTAMRHAVRHEAILDFLRRSGVRHHLAR